MSPRDLVPSRFASIAGLVILGLGWASTSSAISTRTLIDPKGQALNDTLGKAVASAGDFNADGYDDVIVGAPGEANDAGRAYIYFGGPSADDFADHTLTGESSDDYFGHSVSSAGDFNADGYDDVIVGAHFANGTGRAYVYYGGPIRDNLADLTFNGIGAGDLFGISVASIGDWNGDGYDDVVIGSPHYDVSNPGRFFIFGGGPNPDTVQEIALSLAVPNALFGYDVAGIGDFNGDGRDDFAVGALELAAGGEGFVSIYFGNPDETGATRRIEGITAGDQFGTSVAGGDMNGDGYSDLLVGAPLNDVEGANAGRAYVFFGGPSIDVTADLILAGGTAGDNFGADVAMADLNGDGLADAIVGAPFDGTWQSNGGQALIYFGDETPDATADLTISLSTNANDQFGTAVAPAGDVDGDGFTDLVVGSAFGGLGSNGQAHVILFYPYQVISPNGGELWVAGSPATVRWRGHDVANVAISTDGGISFVTVATGVGGEDENELTLVAPGPTEFAKVRVTISGQTVSRATSDQSDGLFRIVPSGPPPIVANRLQLVPEGVAGDQLGVSVASAGDVNRDRYDDWIVGAPGNDTGGIDAGRAYVYFGGPTADNVADWTLSGTTPGGLFGRSVAGVADVNRDGFADVIVGAPHDDVTGPGQAFVFFGGQAPDDVPDLTLTGLGTGGQFGFSVAGAGDVNGDGFPDFIVGARTYDGIAADGGMIRIYLGGIAPDATADLSLTSNAPQIGDQLGISVAGAGDVNRDGFDDVIFGAYLNDGVGGLKPNAGLVYVLLGSATLNTETDHFRVLRGDRADDQFGISVAGAGDVDGDGFDDVIVGAWMHDVPASNAGRVYVYRGGSSSFGVWPDGGSALVLSGEAADDEFGCSVASAGDINADGFDDLVVGAHFSDEGGTNAGRIYIYHGGPGADANAEFVITNNIVGEEFGFSVAPAGDVNRDGFTDVLASAHLSNLPAPGAGAAALYDFNRYHLTSPATGITWNVGATQTIRWVGAEPADLLLSVDGGATYDKLSEDAGGRQLNTFAIRVPHLPTRFARIKIVPSNPDLTGSDVSDSLFTILSSVSLLNLVADLGEGGAMLSWSTDPGVGPEGLAGYRLYRVAPGSGDMGQRIGPELIVESRYTDPAATPGTTYRLIGVNGLAEELELGRVTVGTPFAGMRVWPSPAVAGSAMRIAFPAPLAGAGFAATDLDVGLFDAQGRRVATIAGGPHAAEAGVVSVSWDVGRRTTPPGIYFVRAVAPSAGFRAERKVVILP